MKTSKTMPAKAHLRKSAMLTKAEYHSLVGLLTLAAQHNRDLREIERALLDITRECNYDGKAYEVWGDGHTSDAVCAVSADPPELLRKIGLRVGK